MRHCHFFVEALAAAQRSYEVRNALPTKNYSDDNSQTP